MSRGKKIIAAGIGIALLAVVAYGLQQPIFCSGFFAFRTAARFTVEVPAARTDSFDAEITSFMSRRGLSVVKGTYSTNEPLESRRPYTAYQVEGCDGRNYIWSDNSAKPHEYLVTFHYNPLFKDQTKPLSDAFVREFRSRYDVRPYTGWHQNYGKLR